MKFNAGQRIKFAEERKSYKIIACNERYLICVKPFNLKKTYLYTLVDLTEGERGPDNMIFGPRCDYSNVEEAEEALTHLGNLNPPVYDQYGISARRAIKLRIDWVK